MTLTHFTLTLPNCGPRHLPGRMKKSISLTNLIRLKKKLKRKSSSSRRSFETTGGSSNSSQQPYDWSPGSPRFSVNFPSSSYNSPEYYQPPPPPYYGQYGSPQNWSWPTPVQTQQRSFTRRGRGRERELGAPRFKTRYHPYDPHYYNRNNSF